MIFLKINGEDFWQKQKGVCKEMNRGVSDTTVFQTNSETW